MGTGRNDAASAAPQALDEAVERLQRAKLDGQLAHLLNPAAALDALLDKCRPFGTSVAAVLYFHGRDGIIADQEDAIAILHRKDVKYGKLFYRTGERIGSPQKMPYVARYYLTAATRAEIDTLTEEILASISVKDREGNNLLYPNRIGSYTDTEGKEND